MNISKSLNDSVLTVSLEGRLDTTTSPMLESELNGSYEGITELILDFAALEYISSAGLRVILSAHKMTKGMLKIINVNDSVREIFEITGFSDILNII